MKEPPICLFSDIFKLYADAEFNDIKKLTKFFNLITIIGITVSR